MNEALLELAADTGPAAAALRQWLLGEPPSPAARMAARNQALLGVSVLLSPDAPTSWLAAERLALAVQRFEAITWPRLQRGADPAELGAIDVCLLRARLAWRLPGTQRQLWASLQSVE